MSHEGCLLTTTMLVDVRSRVLEIPGATIEVNQDFKLSDMCITSTSSFPRECCFVVCAYPIQTVSKTEIPCKLIACICTMSLLFLALCVFLDLPNTTAFNLESYETDRKSPTCV